MRYVCLLLLFLAASSFGEKEHIAKSGDSQNGVLNSHRGLQTDKAVVSNAYAVVADSVVIVATPDPTESPAPSPGPSAVPSEEPTESPAPSPSPSEIPTEVPTGTSGPTSPPTGEPTESPAPSPSPSEVPTDHPTTNPSENPTNSPTITNKPTSTPSSIPTNIPSTEPTNLPTASPTITPQPTRVPTAMPTMKPTRLPSAQPTGYPTSTPSDFPTRLPSSNPTNLPTRLPSSRPTNLPSSVPSDFPSLTPSGVPTASPTSESLKAKTAMLNVKISGLSGEMDFIPLAKFEVQTLEFIRATMPKNDDFYIEVLAVTVLTQTMTTEDRNSEQDSDNRRSLSVNGDGVLDVSFRVVGVVSSGVVPQNFDFKSMFGYGFKKHFKEYLQRLSSVDPFFANIAKNKSRFGDGAFSGDRTRFIATIVCSTVAFMIAVFASYYAIKKHLRNSRQGKDMILALPSDPYRTQSSSSSIGQPDVPRIDDGNSLQLQIYPDTHAEGSKNPSPLVSALRACLEGDDTMMRLQESPMSPNTLENGGGRRKSPFGRLSEGSEGIRKWLTPRRESFGRNVFSSSGEPNDDGRQDPPERSRNPQSYNSVSPIDPDARKASTTAVPGAPIILPETRNKRNKKIPQEQAPRSLQENVGPRRGFTLRTPMGSAVGSTAGSFFAKMSGVFGKSTTPSQAGHSDAPRSFAGVSEPGHKYGVESEAGVSAITGRQAFAPASEPGYEMSFESKRRVFEGGHRQMKVSTYSAYPRPPRVESRRSRQNYDRRMQEEIDLPPEDDYNGTASEISVSLNAYGDDEHHKMMNRVRDSDADSRKRSRTYDEDDDRYHLSEQMSEIRLTESIGGTLGAKVESSETYVPNSYGESESFGPSRSRSSNNYYDSHYESPRESLPPSEPINQWEKPFTLGARPLGASEQNQYKEKTSFDTYLAQRAGSYDVFAPSGPIGIVVDTTKNGPAVHSLKSTSPMLGLINPGDLIVALDDEDTRGMTAATLTRLMAKKSRQKERKITLLAMENISSL